MLFRSAQQLTENMGQQIIVENRPGASSLVGTQLVAKAPPDGYTLLAIANTFAMVPSIVSNPGYDPLKDFAPITLTCAVPQVLDVNPALPVKNVRELIALAKAKPGSIGYASSGSGSTPHLAGEYLKMIAHIDLVHVPYKGAAPALNEVLGGHVPITIVGPPPALPHLNSGKLKALAVTTAKRYATLPQVPTIAEAGFTGFDVSAWYGFYAPARTPQAIIARLNRELVAILGKADVRARIAQLGLDVIAGTPEAHAAFIQAELARWTPVIKASNMRIE